MYTNVFAYGNKILLRGYDAKGISFKEKVDFQPTLFTTARKGNPPQSDWKTLNGQIAYEIKPGSMRETKDFVEMYTEVEGFPIYGMTQFEYQFISDRYPGEIEFDAAKIRIFTIDIETATEFGFPNVKEANEEILLVSLMDNRTKNKVVFGCKDYQNNDPTVKYLKCRDEIAMLQQVLNFWRNNTPDVITGWNINFFDIPYLIRRVRRLGLEAELLSPWNLIRDEKAFHNNNQEQIFSIPGVSILDYLELYKKFTFTARESYRLDHIAEVELGQNKLDHSEYSSFKEFYTKNWTKFVQYNIIDVELVDRLEDRLRLINLAYTLAYKAKINYDDVYSPVKTWDILIYNYLREQNTVIPLKGNGKKVPFVGGYVKEPITGMHKWVASFDLNSLYPSLIMAYNMSPETITETMLKVNVDELIEKTSDTTKAHELNYALTANGWTYRRDKPGFLPNLMKQLYSDRVKAKKEMLKLEQEYEQNNDPVLEQKIAGLNTLQMALKVTLNSGYGAVTNAYFRYFDIRIGEGITMSGQLTTRWIARKLNEFLNKAGKTQNQDYVAALDTDSVYLILDKIIEDNTVGKNTAEKIEFMNKFCNSVIQPFIDKSYKELSEYTNAYEHHLKMKLEVLADVGIFYRKKKYLLNVHASEGVLYAEPKLKIKGLSMIQSSTPEVVRDSLRNSIKVALSGSEKDIQKYTCDFKEKFFAFSPDQIAFPRSANGLNEYSDKSKIYSKGTPIAVRGALLYNYHLKRLGLDKKYQLIKNGDKIKFIYLKTPNPFHENIIAFPQYLPVEFGLNGYIDYETQFDKTFQESLKDLVEPMGWNVEEVATLEDFFV